MTQDFSNFIGTRAVSQQHAFDVDALAAWLEKNLDGFRGPLTVEMFKGGQSNPTYKLVTPTQSYVMRAKPGPVAKLLPSAHAVEREFKVMSGLGGTDVPVPRMHCLCEDEAIIGRAFYVMEFMQGRVLWDQSLPGMGNAERAAIYDEMNRVIAALHTVKFAERGLADYGKPGNYFERQIGRWSKQYKASTDGAGELSQPIEAMERLIDWLPAHMPASARDETKVSIVHGDYRLDNVMFHATEPRIIAVLDWELSAIRWRTSATTACPGTCPPPPAEASAAWMSPRWAFPPRANTSAATASARASARPRRWRPTGTSTRPTTCSAWPRSCKALPSGSRPVPHRASKPWHLPAARGRWPRWPGSLPKRPSCRTPPPGDKRWISNTRQKPKSSRSA
jgi:aminoglycoside phosphotransferase (APT) family kinase protein